MSMPMKNVIVSIVMFLVGVGFAYLSSELPDRGMRNIPGPAFFPGLVAVFIIILSLSLLVKGVRGLREKRAHFGPLSIPHKPLFIVFWFLIMLAVLPYAGFLAAGIPFFAGLMILCEKKKPVHILVGSVVIPVFLYFLFREGFSILLPTGQWM